MSAPFDIYTRASRAGEGSTTHEAQEREARDFARGKALTVGRVLKDPSKSSSATLDRPTLQEALRRIRSGESGGIIVAYLSRASRDTRQGLDLLDAVRHASGEVYAPNLPDYTTPDGLMQTTIQFAIDTGYRDRKRDELERRKKEAIDAGIPVNSRPAVGLRQREDRRLEPDPKVAPVVREVFERRSRGAGPTDLAEFLEARKVKTSQGSSTWSKQAVYGLIENEIYMGVLVYGKDRRYVNPHACEPIVDAATWRAAQHPNGTPLPRPKSGASDWLLTGIIRCASCRYALQGTTTSRGRRIYRCTRRHAAGQCPDPVRGSAVAADVLERVAVEEFWRLTEDIEAHGRQDTGDLSGLEAALGRAERLLAQIEDPDAQEALGDRYLDVFRQRREARDLAAEELGHARADVQVTELPSVETLRRAWERMSVHERREMLAARFQALSLGSDGVLVVWPTGSGLDLPRRGFKKAPDLVPFPAAPNGARVLAL
jgi:site-specific DNA recombinase